MSSTAVRAVSVAQRMWRRMTSAPAVAAAAVIAASCAP
jgi:hypothetical protein